MDLKRTLVAITDNSCDAVATETALKIAYPFGGTVRALYAAGESPTAAQFRYPTIGTHVFNQIEGALSNSQILNESNARSSFETHAQKCWNEIAGSTSGSPPIEWTAIASEMPDAMVRQGGIYDLLVIGQTCRANADMVEAALFRSGRPVLFAPETASGTIGQNIMIGWNRSPEAGKSVVNAIPLLQKAAKVTICSITTMVRPGPSPEECADYLEDHEINAEIITVKPGRKDVATLLLEQVESLEADLIVTGANFHIRPRQTILSSVTSSLLENSKTALLMSH